MVMQTNDPMLNHKCHKIAVANMGDGRECWLGELLEPIPGYPAEKYCLHIKTHFKDVVFGLDGNGGDAGVMAVLAQIMHGRPFNQNWLDGQEGWFRKRADRENSGVPTENSR